MRPVGGSWRTQRPLTLRTDRDTKWDQEFPGKGIEVGSKVDFRWRIDSVSANDAQVEAGYVIELDTLLTEST
jgi:hypothetical protein